MISQEVFIGVLKKRRVKKLSMDNYTHRHLKLYFRQIQIN